MYMYRRVCWDELYSTYLSSIEPLMTVLIFHTFHQGKSHIENIWLIYCAYIDTILLHNSGAWMKAQLENVFFTIPAINIRSDLWIFEGGGFVPSITGVETGSTNDIVTEVLWILLAGYPRNQNLNFLRIYNTYFLHILFS